MPTRPCVMAAACAIYSNTGAPLVAVDSYRCTWRTLWVASDRHRSCPVCTLHATLHTAPRPHGTLHPSCVHTHPSGHTLAALQPALPRAPVTVCCNCNPGLAARLSCPSGRRLLPGPRLSLRLPTNPPTLAAGNAGQAWPCMLCHGIPRTPRRHKTCRSFRKLFCLQPGDAVAHAYLAASCPCPLLRMLQTRPLYTRHTLHCTCVLCDAMPPSPRAARLPCPRVRLSAAAN